MSPDHAETCLGGFARADAHTHAQGNLLHSGSCFVCKGTNANIAAAFYRSTDIIFQLRPGCIDTQPHRSLCLIYIQTAGNLRRGIVGYILDISRTDDSFRLSYGVTLHVGVNLVVNLVHGQIQCRAETFRVIAGHIH